MININSNDVIKKDYYPLFILEKQAYYRYEKDGYLTIRVNRTESTNYKILNPTAVYMYSLMDGTKSTEQIFSILLERYGDDLKEKIKKDFKDVIVQGWMLGFIKWKGENPMDRYGIIELSNDYKIKIAFDEDTRELFKFFEQKNIKIFRSPKFSMGYKEPLLLRHNLFMMNFLYFMVYKCEKLISIIIIDVSSNDSCCSIEYIESNVKVEDYVIKQVLLETINNINKYSIKKCNKVKVYIDKKDTSKTYFEELGFQYLATLIKEYKNTDVYLLEKILEV